MVFWAMGVELELGSHGGHNDVLCCAFNDRDVRYWVSQVVQRFQELFAQTKYKEAAELAAESPQGLLRTPDTVAKFQMCLDLPELPDGNMCNCHCNLFNWD
ncbi:hypothetical protein FH972_004840 [Carpinus fangiana]|uniref:Uncharacterized protein n=1 Tax=Carpinus fangiana TaxID=176857 RepID=A0A5N6QPB4_9ROSI|nr:hypothetical protein FH972_004840 [Carpinus fangiana]